MQVDFVHVAARGLLLHTQAVAHFAKWRHRKPARENPHDGPPVPRVSKDDYVANLLEISKLSRAHGAKVVLIGQVYQNAQSNPAEAKLVKEHRDALREAAAANGIPYLQIDELTETNSPMNISLFGELIHPNAAGHPVMARELLKFWTNTECSIRFASRTISRLSFPFRAAAFSENRGADANERRAFFDRDGVILRHPHRQLGKIDMKFALQLIALASQRDEIFARCLRFLGDRRNAHKS